MIFSSRFFLPFPLIEKKYVYMYEISFFLYVYLHALSVSKKMISMMTNDNNRKKKLCDFMCVVDLKNVLNVSRWTETNHT